MQEYKTHLDKNGRILLPAKFRKDYSPGEVFVIRKDEDKITLLSAKDSIKEVQKWAKDNIKLKKDLSMVDDFLASRKEDSGEF